MSGTDCEREGLVITRYGAQMLVEDADGRLHRCTARRRLEHAVCGDRVRWRPAAQGDGIVTEVLARTSVLTRSDARGRSKTVAANIDQLIVVSAYLPQPNWEMVDRYLVAAELLPARAVVVMNKTDLRPVPDPHQGDLEIYRHLGYDIIETSASEAQGLEALRERCRGRTSVLAGQSGVGKSSLIQALLPNQRLRIGEISAVLQKGRHTTTGATLYHLPGGGDLIDSPGVRDFELGPVDPAALARGFVEIHAQAQGCRFHDCSHSVEPGCAVKTALERGEIAARRYRSYLALLQERRRAG